MDSAPYVSFFITSIKQHDYAPDFRLRTYIAERSTLVYVVRGSGTIQLSGRIHDLSPGSFVSVTPAMRVALASSGTQPLSLYFIHYFGLRLSPDYLITSRKTEAQSEFPEPASLPFLPNQSMTTPASRRARINSVLEQLLRLHPRSRNLTGTTAMSFYEQKLLYKLLDLLQEAASQYSSSDAGPVERTLEFMKQNYMKPIPLGELPQLAGLTPSSYCRAFKRATGLTPGGYLSSLRIQHAKELLAQPSRSLKEVARSVGFQDELYFSRVFKQNEGVSPTLYRKRHKKRIAVVSNIFLQDHLVALGIPPIAAPAFPSHFEGGFPSYLRSQLGETIPLNAERHIPWSEVAKLEPDMTLKMSFRHNPYDKQWDRYSGTVFIDDHPNWSDYLATLSEKVGQEAAAESIVARIGQVERTGRDALSSFTRKGRWAVIRVTKEHFRLYDGSSHAMMDLLFQKLGFQPHDLSPGYSYREDAFLDLVSLDPERILVLWSDASALSALQRNPLWQGLQAVYTNQVYVPDSREWDAWGPIGREYTIRECVRYFSKYQ
ncbi:helix-turn-helix domain-containing protein [Paenibacillus turpanensis]|uniref:helix-turn-helix domain-containing protein n=1 Tax=Paenibacillus turpanensis TaxID=2689078 RepID=UPI00140C21C6|nr:helix-turn-helix domain-containing protein [Paenibacillus turpanensis]